MAPSLIHTSAQSLCVCAHVHRSGYPHVSLHPGQGLSKVRDGKRNCGSAVRRQVTPESQMPSHLSEAPGRLRDTPQHRFIPDSAFLLPVLLSPSNIPTLSSPAFPLPSSRLLGISGSLLCSCRISLASPHSGCEVRVNDPSWGHLKAVLIPKEQPPDRGVLSWLRTASGNVRELPGLPCHISCSLPSFWLHHFHFPHSSLCFSSRLCIWWTSIQGWMSRRGQDFQKMYFSKTQRDWQKCLRPGILPKAPPSCMENVTSCSISSGSEFWSSWGWAGWLSLGSFHGRDTGEAGWASPGGNAPSSLWGTLSGPLCPLLR